MKLSSVRYIVFCFLCVLLIGSVTAATMNAVVLKPANQQASVVAVNRFAAITFDSSVHGATVSLDGESIGSTPVTVNLVAAGNHTAIFRLSGYREHVATFYVEAGKPQTIYAQLQQSPSVVGLRTVYTISAQKVQNIEVKTRAELPPSTIVPSPTPTLFPCPVNTTCMSLAKALSTYGADGYTQYSPNPCNFIQVRALYKEKVAEYCIARKYASKPAGRITLNLSNIVEPAGVVQNPVGIVKPVQALPVPVTHSPPVITNVVIVDSFIEGISSGIFNIFRPGPALAVNPGIQAQPISAGYVVAPVIDQGATLFIGEQGLDVTGALNEAYGSERDSIPMVTRIGWWAWASDLYITSPSKTIDLGVNKRYADMTVAPADFVGYTGNWYLLNAYGIAPASTNSVVFIVAEPSVGKLLMGSANSGPQPINGQTVTRGEIINFQIPTNMSNLRLSTHRGPFSEDDGFMDIRVQDPTGALLTSVAFSSGDHAQSGTMNLLKNCGYDTLSGPEACSIPANTWQGWDTAAKDSNGQYLYPAGTYTLWAESHLNNMKNYYLNGGQPFTGRTVSEKVTFTLAEEG
jgi:hypothetical protein